MGRREEENRLFNTHIKCIVQKPHTPVMVRVLCVLICVSLPVAHANTYCYGEDDNSNPTHHSCAHNCTHICRLTLS